jgi:hypothetical protein
MADLTISGSGAHASAAATDRIPAMKSTTPGYLTPSTIKDYILGLAGNIWTQTQTFTTETVLLRWGATSGDAAVRGNGAFTECRVGDNSGYGPLRASSVFAMDGNMSAQSSHDAYNGTATPAAASAVAGVKLGTAAVGIYWGTGSPNAALTAPRGSIYLRTDGGAGTSLYTNTDGSTAWSAV